MRKTYTICFLVLVVIFTARAQKLSEETFQGLKLRNIGPALTSGRIADIAIHPEDENTWYVAVGSGGVWKTENAATTWKPVFDGQDSYSIGCVTIDSRNPDIVWVGTGENVGGRHVGFGDGVYKSTDGGTSWKNMGLKASEHISKIVVHPDNSNVIWVAAQGPLWSKGDERGLYKSTDGGQTWKKTLGNNEWTGVTDILINPDYPNILYAATWDRHRTVAAYMGGGPGSAIHKSTDGGESWIKLETGLPNNANMGKIGLAMSPFNNDVIYAAIELERLKGAVYISRDEGSSWAKQSNTVSGGTGPHYYQELYASPHEDGKLFLMNNNVLISEDHGKTFYTMNETNKHVDSHAMAFKPSDDDYVLFGTDGGLYESYDGTKSWKFIPNLPIVQYYKIAVDDTEPFYNIYGGTQDNGSHGGPSQTMYESGISNRDWWITLGADGHQSAVEPGNPDITYGEFQQGFLWRIDQITGESVFIQPQPRKGEPYERFNWDSPILVSPHDPTRLYFASYRVWKSNNRGDSWEAISSDLTRNEERLSLPIMGKMQSWDNAWDVNAMSNYNTITSLAESPLQEGLLYAGTDDGILQVSENGGQSWRKVQLGSINGVSSRAFVNDVRADLHDASTVYLALDNHKEGDFKPYLLKSTDKGRTWTSINGNLPGKMLTWRLVQDHVDKNLLFAATEYGIYFTKDGGSNWVKLKGNVPTIAFRDIAIQRRENDLVAGSFGRGIYILDDITPIREFSTDMLNKEAHLFAVQDALWYSQRQGIYGRGDGTYYAENPPYGAVFNYFLSEKFETLEEQRKKKEKALNESNANVPFPGWDALDAEKNQEEPTIMFTIRDTDGNVINTIKGKNEKGFSRVNWDFSYSDRSGVSLSSSGGGNNFFGSGTKATPGVYTVTLSKMIDGVMTDLAGPVSFNVVPLKEKALEGKPYDITNEFRDKYHMFQQDLTATTTTLENSIKKVAAMQKSLLNAPSQSETLVNVLYKIRMDLAEISKSMNGSPAKNEIGERNDPSPADGMMAGVIALNSTYGPTENHIQAFNRANDQLQEIKANLSTIIDEQIPAAEDELKSLGAPWVEGQGLMKN